MKREEKRLWRVLKSKYIIKRPWLTARCDDVILPNGNEIPEYYVLEYPDWINVIAITGDNKFVFIKQYRHGLGNIFYELCAGVCEEGETPLESAQRELLEETGYGGGKWEIFMKIAANPGSMNNYTYCFLATGVEKISEQHLEDTEDITVHLLSINEVRKLLEDDNIKQSLHAAPLWKFMAKKSTR